MKTSILSISLASSLLFLGCGDSSNNTSSLSTTDITVERGPVLNAVVLDAAGQVGEHLGNGVYRFIDPEYPVESYGGYIDMNRNNSVDVGDIEMKQLRLRTNSGKVMTLATTLDGNVTSLLTDIGYSDELLFGQTPSTNMDIAALSDELYMYCYENNISDPSKIGLSQMQNLQQKIQERKSFYESSGLSASDLEDDLMKELNVDIIDESDLNNITTNVMGTMINATPLAELTEEQKYTIAYMWNEEKLAKDIYLALNELTPSNTLYNIATNAETSHMAAVENLIQKYDLNILNIDSNYTGGYDSDALSAYKSGEYSIKDVGDLYDTLYEKGSLSLKDALEVGCMVEVTDINDLNEDLETVDGVEDLVAVFESLRQGSYSHYWAFDRALKNINVSDGCCSLGDDYCKTTDEYPVYENGSGSMNKHGRL